MAVRKRASWDAAHVGIVVMEVLLSVIVVAAHDVTVGAVLAGHFAGRK